jgi:hypothetical protein
MAEGRIYVGSRARVWIPALDLTPEGETAFEPSDLTVHVIRPDGTELEDVTIGEEAGEYYLEFALGELNQAGPWLAHGDDAGYKFDPIGWAVYRTPS